MPRAESDLRVFTHDVLFQDHDKDYRTHIAFPIQDLERCCIFIIRVNYWGHSTVDSLVGRRYNGSPKWNLWALTFQAHMRTALADKDAGAVLRGKLLPLPDGWTESPMIGWRAHLDAARRYEPEMVPYEKCSRCPKETEDSPERAGAVRAETRKRSFGSYPVELPFPDEHQSAGGDAHGRASQRRGPGAGGHGTFAVHRQR